MRPRNYVCLVGKKFNRLLVIAETRKNNQLYWLCKCDCGKEKLFLGNSLKTGNTKSCGCLYKDRTGKKCSQWKGGKSFHYGYKLILTKNNNYIREHRLVMEKQIGRKLLKDEVVHHINHKKDDNRIENLMLFQNQSKHIKFHSLNKQKYE